MNPQFFCRIFIFPDELHTKSFKKCSTILVVKFLIMFTHQNTKPLPLEIYKTIAPTDKLNVLLRRGQMFEAKCEDQFSPVKAKIILQQSWVCDHPIHPYFAYMH